jgi:hypothetical protein
MAEKPKIFLSNWASHKTAGHHGPGRLYSIMVKTPWWARSTGRVDVLVPPEGALWDAKSERIDMATYKRLYLDKLDQWADRLAPGKLVADEGGGLVMVTSGDTLCCSCARSVAVADKCHRAWAARRLLEAGWNVVLDGEPLSE